LPLLLILVARYRNWYSGNKLQTLNKVTSKQNCIVQDTSVKTKNIAGNRTPLTGKVFGSIQAEKSLKPFCFVF